MAAIKQGLEIDPNHQELKKLLDEVSQSFSKTKVLATDQAEKLQEMQNWLRQAGA